jgi:hypothetical protein
VETGTRPPAATAAAATEGIYVGACGGPSGEVTGKGRHSVAIAFVRKRAFAVVAALVVVVVVAIAAMVTGALVRVLVVVIVVVTCGGRGGCHRGNVCLPR